MTEIKLAVARLRLEALVARKGSNPDAFRMAKIERERATVKILEIKKKALEDA